MSNSWLMWLYGYLGTGLLIALVFYGISLKDRPSQFVRDMRSALGLGKTLEDYLQDVLVYSIAIVAISVGWPGFLVWAALKRREDRMRELEEDEPEYLCKPEYLVRRVTPVEAEHENIIHDSLGLTSNSPFGHLNVAWGKFLAELGFSDEDEPWYFEIPKGSDIRSSLKSEGPISGYAKVVRGKVLGEFVVEAS